MENELYDFNLTGFNESENVLIHRNSLKYYNYNTDLRKFLVYFYGTKSYNKLPRAINEENYKRMFDLHKNDNYKAGLVYIIYKPCITWVHMALFVSSSNNYYGLTYFVNENLEKYNSDNESIFNKAILFGQLASISRYRYNDNISKM